MEPTVEEVLELLEVMKGLDRNEVEVTIGGVHLAVRKEPAGARAVAAPASAVVSGPAATVSSPGVATPAAGAGQAGAPADTPAGGVSADELADWLEREAAGTVAIVRAPMVGTVYRAKEPGAPPFVEVGGTVASGDTVCLVEVMKLFNSVTAPQSGRVGGVFFEDATVVEYMQPLVAIELG